MNAYIVQLQCITNMHVGNGDVNYNIIDNEVEKDPVTNYPVINASGVKGALREYCEAKYKEQKETIDKIFGKKEKGDSSPGQVKILGAEMVAIPARASMGDNPFYLISTERAIARVNELSNLFINRDLTSGIQSLEDHSVEIEGYAPKKSTSWKASEDAADKDIYIMNSREFEMIDLPVLARNQLDNGISKNLWYEEVVPHDSIFIFPVISEDSDLLEDLAAYIDDQVIQFGGNASIGYGLCKVAILR